jgi:secondary thiamine-phosphate synthase enzyme
MIVTTRSINVDTNTTADEAYVSVINITPQVHKHAMEDYISKGIVTLFVPATTAALGTIEFEEGLIADFKKIWSRLVPRDIAYKHKFLWEENNAFSHVRASILGPSLVVPMTNKRLILGQYQQIVLVEFDNRARSRQIAVQFMGE